MSDLNIIIDGQPVDCNLDETGVPISYKLEETENFQQKSSSSALSIILPATKRVSLISNNFHNPAIQDLSSGEAFRNSRPASIIHRGWELLNGKAYLKYADCIGTRPTAYQYDFFGDNSDWIADLSQTTFYDVLSKLQFQFTVGEIMDSWKFDGTDESKPYVFAPVRYGQPLDDGPANYVEADPPLIKDFSMAPEYMKPAISVYWLLVWGFRSIGYRINSNFLQTNYFKRLVMPWTWGNFLYSDGTQTQNLNFLAKSTAPRTYDQDMQGIIDILVSNDTTNGAYDDNDAYQYDATNFVMKWTYLPQFDYGTLEANFHVQVNYSYVATDSGNVEARVQWFHNGTRITTNNPGENGNGDKVFAYNAPKIGGNRDAKIIDIRLPIIVNAGDTVEAKFYGWLDDTGLGTSHMTLEVLAFEIEYFRVPLGGTIKFTNYLSFKKYLFLDFFRGLVDSFNLIPKADSVTKEITIEPQHSYQLNSYPIFNPGYFNNNFVDWNKKQDISIKYRFTLFSEYNRNVIFSFKDDSNDGILKLIQDRYTIKLAQAKYVLPNRFVKDNSDAENRFFSPVMHYNVTQWKTIGTYQDAPQIVCMIPENISNTSHEESQNTFSPKLCWYKGMQDGYGWVFNKIKQFTYPYMFAVNYKPGGDDDPILSYSDERLTSGIKYLFDINTGQFVLDEQGDYIIVDRGGTTVIGKGLMRRFYLQRMAIMRNGQYLTSNFKLKNIDVSNVLHREHIICMGDRYELTEIKNYNPVSRESVQCELRKYAPIMPADLKACYPSKDAVAGNSSADPLDLKYYPLVALSTDIKSE